MLPTQLRFSAITHVGRVRQVNEDSILSLPEYRTWIISDGMGGHSAGDFASGTIIDAIALAVAGNESSLSIEKLEEAIQNAHRLIQYESHERGDITIGATVVALFLHGEHFSACWVGDSRLYRFRHGRIELLTCDHSVIAERVLSGEISWDEAELDPASNIITRAVGVGEVLEIDRIQGSLCSGDRFLICSDGLTKYASFGTLEQAMSCTTIDHLADDLLQMALQSGGADNISIIVVDVL